MSKAKYNVLMMRDNSPVKRFRMSPAWLKMALYVLILLVTVAGLGGYFGLTYWKQNTTLTEELSETQRELREARIELERLQNVDKILKSNDPEELQALFGNVIAEPTTAHPAAKPVPKVNLSTVFKRVDTQSVKVDNLQIKPIGSKLRLSFNLNNLQTEETVSGRASLEIVTNEGKNRSLALNSNDMVFQIQRFKQISTTFTLPQKMTLPDVFGLRLVIKDPSGKVIFSETYPLSYVMS
ncbi:hypothetical protein [Desulfovibrio ferrophilus]|uniref:Uncharacterized protein n=1 Tax=Desulfovibrio ferrophilus TaxID=241368 RepID=A0A2Z6B207_9BACT|nr:hypothetical protein [Desulfovibrio ferrophilus]BBD09478.1 uncharacterized protein DFE_2752 [Desulfovibrio ferrophilus]